jgi:hypothetical protein
MNEDAARSRAGAADDNPAEDEPDHDYFCQACEAEATRVSKKECQTTRGIARRNKLGWFSSLSPVSKATSGQVLTLMSSCSWKFVASQMHRMPS